MASNYITVQVLSAINSGVVADLKTAYNFTSILSAVSSTSISIPPIYPETSSTPITMPIFSAVRQKIYPYSNIDVVQDLSSSALSAYPEPCVMTISAEDGTSSSVTGLSTNECMIYAIANGVIRKLDNDNMLFNISAVSGLSAVEFPLTLSTINTTPPTPAVDSLVLYVDSTTKTLCMKYPDGSVWELTMNRR